MLSEHLTTNLAYQTPKKLITLIFGQTKNLFMSKAIQLVQQLAEIGFSYLKNCTTIWLRK